MKKTQTIYIIIEDCRERKEGVTGKIFYSLEDTCEFLIRRVWHFETGSREWIKQKWDELGPVEAWHKYVCSAWLYCPTYVCKRIKINTH